MTMAMALRDERKVGFAIGWARGWAKTFEKIIGKAPSPEVVAKAMLEDEFRCGMVAEATGLSYEEVRRLDDERSKSDDDEDTIMVKAKSILESTRALMQAMGWTADEALRAMMVPEEEQARYLEMLSKE